MERPDCSVARFPRLEPHRFGRTESGRPDQRDPWAVRLVGVLRWGFRIVQARRSSRWERDELNRREGDDQRARRPGRIRHG